MSYTRIKLFAKKQSLCNSLAYQKTRDPYSYLYSFFCAIPCPMKWSRRSSPIRFSARALSIEAQRFYQLCAHTQGHRKCSGHVQCFALATRPCLIVVLCYCLQTKHLLWLWFTCFCSYARPLLDLIISASKYCKLTRETLEFAGDRSWVEKEIIILILSTYVIDYLPQD